MAKNKNVKGGQAIWASTLGQLGGGDLSYVMAGVAKHNDYRSEQGVDVASVIISGTQALKNKALIMPSDDVFKLKFSEYVGSTVSGETANMSFAAYKSIYAHLSEQSNYQHKDSNAVNTDLSNTALSLATGGVYAQKRYGEYGLSSNTWKVSKPYGMDDSRFKNFLEKGYRKISNDTGVSIGDLEDLRLRRSVKKSDKGEIQYDLINERGNPLIVDGVEWRINMTGVTK